MAGGFDPGVGELRADVLADDALQLDLLHLNIGLRCDQVASIGGQLGFGLDDIKARQNARLKLLPVVLIQFLCRGHGLFSDIRLLLKSDVIPVKVRGVRESVVQVLTENLAADFAIVFRDGEEAAIQSQAEAVEQRLINRNGKKGSKSGIEQKKTLCCALP